MAEFTAEDLESQMRENDISMLSGPESQGLEGHTRMVCLTVTPQSGAAVAGPWEHLALEVTLRSLSA